MIGTPPRLEIVDGIDGLQAVFDDMARRHREADFTPTLRTFANETLKKTEAEFFERGAGPSGAAWPDWRWRRPQSNPDHPNLIDTKRLQASLTTDSPDHIQSIAPRAMNFGTSVPYAAIQNFGGETVTQVPLVGRNGGFLPAGSRIQLPPREHVGMTEATVDELCNQTADRETEILKDVP